MSPATREQRFRDLERNTRPSAPVDKKQKADSDEGLHEEWPGEREKGKEGIGTSSCLLFRTALGVCLARVYGPRGLGREPAWVENMSMCWFIGGFMLMSPVLFVWYLKTV